MTEIGVVLYIGLGVIVLILGVMWILLPIWVHQMVGKLDGLHGALHLIGKELEEIHADMNRAANKNRENVEGISENVAKLKKATLIAHNLEEG